jgi:hypothetical protein
MEENGHAEENGNGRRGYVLFAWSPDGYTLRELDGDPPQIGAELENGGRELVVTRIGPSPLPGDSRPCAFTSGK